MAKKNALSKKDLVSAYNELNEVVNGVEPPIKHAKLSDEEFEKELWKAYLELAEEEDEFTKKTQGVFDALVAKYGSELPEEDDNEEEEEDEEEEDEEEEDEEEDDEEEEEDEEEEAPPVKKGKKTAPAPAPAKGKGKKKPEPEPEEEEEEDEEEEKPATVKKGKEKKEEKPAPAPAKKGKEKKEEPAPVKKGKEKKEEKKKGKREATGGSASNLVREMTCKNPDITTEEILAELAERGMNQSAISVNIRRMEMLHAIKIIKKIGLPK